MKALRVNLDTEPYAKLVAIQGWAALTGRRRTLAESIELAINLAHDGLVETDEIPQLAPANIEESKA